MECSASTGVLHRPYGISKFVSAGISYSVRIGVKPKQYWSSAVGRSGIIRAAHCEYAYPLPSSSSSLSSLYDVLSVSPNVSEREIKSAYRRMALRYHPDVCPSSEKEECTTKFLQIQEAYHTLSDACLREDYDWKLHNGMELGENDERIEFDSSDNVWEVQLMELMRIRSRRSNNNNSSSSDSWGSRMRSRNQHEQMPSASAASR